MSFVSLPLGNEDMSGASETVAESLRPVPVKSMASASRDSGKEAGVLTGEKPNPTVDGARMEIFDAKAGCRGRL